MSWSGFKKAASRAGTQLQMKAGRIESTSDREYEVEERRYRTLESASLRLQKEAKGYLDSLRAMTASQMRIAETIDAFYGESGAKDGVSRSYKQAVEDLDAETVKALDGPYRCVPLDLYEFVFDEEKGMFEQGVVDEIEREMNLQTGKRRLHVRVDEVMEGQRGDSDGFDGAIKLMDFVYRTTVLEPINRFCAYFPDINECIKKRNHKMLDYDAMRSKVKRLVEKPDKDPAKLPRTEKETEMVSMTDFLHETKENEPSMTDTDSDMDVDFSIPSPPKALDKIKRVQLLQQEHEELARRHSGLSGLSRSPSVLSRVTSIRKSSPRVSSESADERHRRSEEGLSSHSSFAGQVMGSYLPMARESSTEALLQPSPPRASHSSIKRSSGSPGSRPTLTSTSTPKCSSRKPLETLRPGLNLASAIAAGIGKRRKANKKHTGARLDRTPFFHPSELEEIMQPLRQEFLLSQTNMMVQAKAAYEQLNEQLTNEIPQLIDLRVPYLDPSFEALVKIQLRFCAEAYSRMAQVQQYLDASTRDQYASGDLDARVEDVLGQIRELSIAGTV